VKRISKNLAIAVAVAAGYVAAALPAHATSLAPGSTVGPGAGGPSGSKIADTGVVAFGNLTTGGFVQEQVYKGNLFGANDLSFVYQFQVSNGDIARLTGSAFGAFLTDVTQAPNAAGEIAAISADRGPSGDPVGFNFTFPPGVVSPQLSFQLVVATNATNFTGGNIGLIDAVTSNVPGFAPFAPVPEPASIVMLGLGAAGMCGYGWRRRKAAV
jgi:hypothetical protein